MKFLCVILSIYVFLLSSGPCCSEGNCMEDMITEQTNHDDQDHKDNDCNTCPPFFSCGTCSGFVFTTLEFELKEISLDHVEICDRYKSHFTHSVFVRIWQPPKIYS